MMIELILLEHLNDALSVPVVMEVPAVKPDAFVLVEKTGGRKSNQICSATVAIQSYHTSLYNAAMLNESVKVAMEGIVERDDVSRAKLNSDYNYTDTASKTYRYQAVYDVVYFE